MKININVTVNVEQPVEEEPQYAPEVWPTMLAQDEPGQPLLTAEFYDFATEPVTETTYRTIPTWSRDVSIVDTGGWLYKSGCFSYWFTAEQHVVNLISNEPGPSAEWIRNQLDPGNENIWNRMPLVNLPERDSLSRGTINSGPQCNFRLTLTRKVADYSDDLKLAGSARGGGYVMPQPDATHPAKLVFGAPPKGRFGLKFSEIGSRFLNHYTDAGGQYVAEWILPDTLYWMPWDTGDSDNYKVTREPFYESEEVGGKIINLFAGTTKLWIGLVPRDWCYYCRLDSAEIIPGQESPMAVTWKYDATYGEDPIYYEYHTGGWDDIDGPPPCDEADYFPADPSDGEALYAWLLDHGWYLTGSSNLTNVAGCLGIGPIYQSIRSWPRWSTDFYAHACAANGELISYTVIGECDWVEGSDPPVIDHSGHHVITACYHALKHSSVLNKYTHNIGLVWGRPPVEFAPPDRDSSYWTDDGQVFQHHGIDGLIGDEGLGRAREHRTTQLVQGGMAEADAEAQANSEIISGYTAHHCIVEQDSETVSHNFKGDSPDGNNVDYINLMRGKIWNRIRYASESGSELSSFWTQFGVPNGTWWASEGFEFDSPVDTDSVPIGMGISPAKAGALCAVIKINDSLIYYVWRKTDEVFETANLGVSPAEAAGEQIFPTLEGWEGAEYPAEPASLILGYATYNLGGGEQQFSGQNGYIDAALIDYQVSCQDGTCVSGPSGGATYALPTEFYPLIVHQTPAVVEA